MNRTQIGWVKNTDNTQGYTLNPMTGCLNCIGGKCGGIFPCYAYLESMGRCHWQDLKGEAIQSGHEGESFYPRLHLKRFNQLWTAPDGAGIFICDRSDWAASYWPEWCQRLILEYARTRPDIRLYLLTKQPQNLTKQNLFKCKFPDNCWPGVTAINHIRFAEAYYHLANIGAKVKYISIEPLLNWDERAGVTIALINQAKQAGVNWIILGSQTKPYRPPAIESVKEIVEACDKAGILVFLKDNLYQLFVDNQVSIRLPDWAKAEIGGLRQEMPTPALVGAHSSS